MSPFQRFMAELRRRHVPQTVAVYAVAAWAAIQFADVVVPNLGWPQWVVTATIIAAGIGLPVVLALSWFLEWGPEGVHRTPDALTDPATTGAEGAPSRPERGTPVEPRPSYAPWAVALGALAIGVAGALIYVALAAGGDPATAAADEDARTRSARRQEARGLEPPIPPTITGPGIGDSLARAVSDSVLGALDSAGIGDMGALIDMARRIGEASSRAAAGGPVEILQPDTWRYGAPHPLHPGDTLVIEGVARANQGVVAVELDGRVVARSDGEPELPFAAEWVAGQGRGFRQLRLTIRPSAGEPFQRTFSITLIPREPEG